MDEKEWLNPSSGYRSAPFWSINGKLEPKRLCTQIESMHKAGMGGFYFHSRQGLKTSYLSDEWFDAVDACVQKAKELDMKACLYDEDKYTSGFAGGYTTEVNPEYRLRLLVARSNDESVAKNEKIVGRFAADISDSGIMQTYRKVSSAKEVKAKETYLVVCESVCPPRPWFNNGTSLDMCNAEAVKAFIDCTYEPYYKKFGKDFGDTIPSIFTDETRIGWIEFDARELKDYIAAVLYTKDGLKHFEKKYNYCLDDILPELFFTYRDKLFSKVAFDYISMLAEMFLNNYTKQISEWCKTRNIKFTGHLFLSEYHATLLTGLQMPHFYYFGWPGMDLTSGDVSKLSAMKMASSVANQFDKERVLCELYGCTGWDWKLAEQRFHGDWQYALGVNYRCQHLTMYSLAGFGKKDYPASIGWQSPWWKYYSGLEDYFGRLSYILSRGHQKNNVLLICPNEGLLGFYRGTHKKFANPAFDEMMDYNSKYIEAVKTLLLNNVCFDFGDEELMSRFASVEDGVISIGSRTYDTVLTLPMVTMRESTKSLIKKVRNYVNADFEEIKSIIPKLNKPFTIYENGKSAEHFFTMFRNIGNGEDLLFVQSQDRENDHEIEIKFNKKYKHITIMDAETGKKYPHKNSTFTIPKSLSVLILLSDFNPDNLSVPPKHFGLLKEQKIIGGEFSFDLSEKNAMPLDYCRLIVDGEEIYKRVPVDKAEDWILRKYGLNNKEFYNSAQPWYLYNTGRVDLSPRGKVVIEFDFVVKDLPNGISIGCEYWDGFIISCNNKTVGEFTGTFIDEDIVTADISNFVVEGKNIVRIEFDYRADMELENFYLIGGFGVDGKDYSIVKQPQKLKLGSLADNNLPFYTGCVDYSFAIDYHAGDRVTISNEGIAGTMFTVKAGDKTVANVFNKSEIEITELLHSGHNELKLEIVVGRANILGPLHVSLGFVEPAQFLSNHPDWNDEYMLKQNGLLQGIKINVYAGEK